MPKRFFSLFFCIILIFSCIPVFSFQTDEAAKLSDDVEIPAVNYFSVSDEAAFIIGNHWITGVDSVKISGDYGAERSISYRLSAEEAGIYNFGIRMSVWRNGRNDNPEITAYLDGAEIGKAMVPYDNNAVRPDKLLDVCDIGKIYISCGIHTVTLSTNWGCDTWLQSIRVSRPGIKMADQTIFVGDSKEIKYEVVPSGTVIEDLIWESSDPGICAVSDGIITGVSEGEAAVMVSSESRPEMSASCTVTVIKPTVGEPYDGKPAEIFSGSSPTMLYAAKINKNAVGSGGEIYDFYGGSDTIESNIDNMAVRSLTANVYWYYTVDVKEAGLYKIELLGTSGWMMSEPDGGARFTMSVGSVGVADENYVLPAYSNTKGWYQFTDSDRVSLGEFYLDEGVQNIKITITNPPINGEAAFRKIWFTFIPTLKDIKVSEPEIDVGRGKSKKLEYELVPSNVNVDDFEWESSNPQVCTAADGIVTGVSKGNAEITLKSPSYPDITAKWNITVSVTADSVTLNETRLSMKTGESAALKAAVLPEDTDDKTVVWQSSNREVASVKDGIVTAKEAGTAIITAVCGDVSASAAVTVSSGGSSGGSGGSGGGKKYIPAVYTDSAAAVNNEFNVIGENVTAADSVTMEKIFSSADTIRYNVASNRVSAEINGEFFTKNPSSKTMVYSLNGAEVSVGADALNKLNPGDNSKIVMEACIENNIFKINMKSDGADVPEFNDSVYVRIPADKSLDYTVMLDGKEVCSQMKDGFAVFSVNSCGEYEINTAGKVYSDLKSVEWAEKDIMNAVENGWLEPESEKKFGADSRITRGELVYAVVKALGLSCESSGSFEDVSPDNKYFREISAAKTLGIINGVDGKNFLPDSFISRQDMAVVIFNALSVKGRVFEASNVLFADDAEIEAYARGSVYKLAGGGILKGSDSGFEPVSNTTRAETAVLLGRIYK